MKLFIVTTKSVHSDVQKQFVVMAESKKDIENNLSYYCSTFSSIHDEIKTIVEAAGIGVRIS